MQNNKSNLKSTKAWTMSDRQRCGSSILEKYQPKLPFDPNYHIKIVSWKILSKELLMETHMGIEDHQQVHQGLFWDLIVVLTDIGDNIAYTHR